MRKFLAILLINVSSIIIKLTLIISVGCTRRPLYDEVCSSTSNIALIPVKIDWSVSSITPSQNSYDEDYVNRVSLRFFPKDGGEVFDRYLESDIYEGYIELPVGEYSVVVFNESIYDPYWSGVFSFENVDDYDNFMAELVNEDEEYSTEAYKLASWSLAEYEVTTAMATASYTSRSSVTLTSYENSMFSALEQVILQPLTCYVNVSADITNLSSAQSVVCDVHGFSSSVYMASGESHTTQTKHSMELITREYTDDQNQHGTISHKRLILTESTHEDAYLKLEFEIYLSDGSLHAPDEPLEFDVDHQATRYASSDYDLSAQFELPEVTSGIDVEGWVDEEAITIF